jgi:hypothetical protein
MKVAYKLRVALPCIIVGALVGSAVGDGAFGTRVGIIVGGGVAFFILHQKKSSADEIKQPPAADNRD